MPYTINDKTTYDRLNRKKPVDTAKVRAAQNAQPSRMSQYIKQDINAAVQAIKQLPTESIYPRDRLMRGVPRLEANVVPDTQGTSQPKVDRDIEMKPSHSPTTGQKVTPKKDTPSVTRNISPDPRLQKKGQTAPDRGQKSSAPQKQAFTPNEDMVNFWLNNLERQNTNVRNMGGNQVLSSGVMVPGLSTQEHYAYSPDQREMYADKIRQGLIQNNRNRQEYFQNNPPMVEYLMGSQPMYANPNDPMQRYGTRGEAEKMEALPVTEAEKTRQAELEKAKIGAGATLGAAKIRGQYGVQEAEVRALQQAQDPMERMAKEADIIEKTLKTIDPTGMALTDEQRQQKVNEIRTNLQIQTGDAKPKTIPETGQKVLQLNDGTLVDPNTLQEVIRQPVSDTVSFTGPQFNPIADMNQNIYDAQMQDRQGRNMVAQNQARQDWSWGRKDNRSVRRFENSWFNRVS
jgi:hypothetical protein